MKRRVCPTSGYGSSGTSKQVKLWIKLIRRQKICKDAVYETDKKPDSPEKWAILLSEALKPLDVACPIVMTRHVRDFDSFQRAFTSKDDKRSRRVTSPGKNTGPPGSGPREMRDIYRNSWGT